MRNGILCLTSALMVPLILVGKGVAQPPGDRRPPGPFGGPGFLAGPLERAVDDLQLPEGKRETALAAVRSYQDNFRRVSDLANSALLLKMKEVLSQEEFQKLGE